MELWSMSSPYTGLEQVSDAGHAVDIVDVADGVAIVLATNGNCSS